MFDSAELGHSVTQARYDAALPKLRSRLLQAHFQLRTQKFPVIVIVSGADGAGKGDLVHRLNEWLDPRGVSTHAFWATSDEERERPSYWRFWRALPPRGRIGILFGSWYSEPIIRRVFHEMKSGRFDRSLDRIVAFENMLAADGAVIVKLWLHLPKAAQKARLKKLERDGRIAPDDWKHFKLYDRFTKVSARALRHTGSPAAPWHVIEATDRRYRELAAGRILLDTLTARLKSAARPAAPAAAAPAAPRRAAARPAKDSVLAKVDLTRKLTPAEYARALERAQTRLAKLAWAAHEKGRSMVLVFEGWDAAGKGSAIRRVTQAMDPRLYQVVGIAAPTDEERAQHYLWRFWRHLPRAGQNTLFDRSWYGRVLVERVEGFARPDQWGRAYGEIVDFEEQLADHGIIVGKFWLHISPQEQLRRFKERQTVDYKQYKITEEDWRNRAKWPDYLNAVEDMVAKCSTEFAPWTLVAGNDKRFARVQILETIVQRLEDSL
ncbi:MAG: polyphosphate:AMP phosphotransferase [Verrucomicrobia bacterium]|nr:polyphosphate:AMP phosphotransferase [Verrucomicrobiota bacterium]